MIDATGKNLIFVLSTPRAGSTLLGTLLGNHSRTLCPSEPWLLLAMNAVRDPKSAVISASDHEQARAAMSQLVDEPAFDASVRASVATIYNTLLSAAGREIFVDKTPRYFHVLPQLDRWFPDAKKVWIRRNPLDTIASCKQTWELTIDEILGQPVTPYSFDATISFAMLADYFAAASPNKFVVDYEDLAADPEPNMRTICEFAGLSFEPGMVEYGQNENQMKMHAQNTMGDKKILEHKRPHRDSVGRWKKLLSPEEVKKILKTLGGDLFRRLGCEPLLHEAAAYAQVDPAAIDDKGSLAKLFHELAIYADQRISAAENTPHSLASRQNAQLRSHLDSLRIDYDKRLQVILEQQSAITGLQSSVTQVTRQLEEVSADYDKRLQVILQQQQQVAELQAQHSATESKLQVREADLKKHEESAAALSQQLQELQARTVEQLAAISRHEASQRQSIAAVSEARLQVTDLQARLDALRLDYDRQGRIVLEQQTTASSLNQRLEELRQATENLQRQLQERDARIAGLESGLLFRVRRFLGLAN